jgi:phage-related protein
MSDSTYPPGGVEDGKPLVWLAGEIRTPPMARDARVEAGFLLRRLQRGESLSLPSSRPMPSIGRRCHELSIVDRDASWRIIHRLDADAVVILEVFAKTTRASPRRVIQACQARLRRYDQADGSRSTP